MTLDRPQLAAAVLGGIILALVYVWHRSLKRHRAITDTPTYAIRSAPQGFVELVGKARSLPGVKTVSELTRHSCVWYRFRVERQVMRSGKPHWDFHSSGHSDQNFLLEDDTGQCVIDPDDAEMLPTVKEIWYTSEGNGERLRHTEERIHEGEPLYGLGFFQSFAPPSFESEVNSLTSDILAEWKRDHEWLLLHFDRDKNGEIDEVEWELARQKASVTATYQVQETYDHEPYNVLTKSPNRGQPLIIATHPHDKVARRYLVKSVLVLVAAGLLLVALLVWVLPQTGWIS